MTPQGMVTRLSPFCGQRTAGAALQIARHADRGLQAQLHRVGEGQLDLRFLAGRTYHTQGHFALFGLDGHALVAGELAGLDQITHFCQLISRAEELLHIRLTQMHMAVGGHHRHAALARPGQLAQHQPLHRGAQFLLVHNAPPFGGWPGRMPRHSFLLLLGGFGLGLLFEDLLEAFVVGRAGDAVLGDDAG